MHPSELAVSHAMARINGRQFHYVEAGRGPLVVLLHGFPETWWSWRRQILPIASAEFRVVAPDQRGYGDSEKHGPFDLDTLSSDVSALIRHLGAEKAHVVGHDWGAVVAWHLAAMEPARVDRVVAINGPHPACMEVALVTSPRQLLRSWYIFAFQIPLLPEVALSRMRPERLRRLYPRSAFISEEELTPFAEGLRQKGAARAMIGWYRSAFRGALLRRLAASHYPRVEADALIIWGRKDPALDYDAIVPRTERYARRLQIEAIPDAGHFVHEERPEEVTELILRFLGARQQMERTPAASHSAE